MFFNTNLEVGFSKSQITSFINFVGYPALMDDCLLVLTSAFQLMAIRFARCKTQTRHTSFTKASILVDKHTSAKQHVTSRFVLMDIQMLISSRGPAKHIRRHYPKFMWEVLITAHSWLQKRMKRSVLYRTPPSRTKKKKKQMRLLDLTLFSMGTGIT